MEHITISNLLTLEFNEEVVNDLWFDWFCADTSLYNRGKKLLSKVKAVSKSKLIDTDKTYVFFKNNCPLYGDEKLYDDFRICDIETGTVLFTFVPRNPFGKAEVWGRDKDNEFGLLIEAGSWSELKKQFLALEVVEIKEN